MRKLCKLTGITLIVIVFMITTCDNYGNLTSGVSVPMVYVPGGSFQMGKDLGTATTGDSKPVHTVTLTSFYMGTFEVTQAQYRAVMGSNPSDYYSDYYGVANNYPVYCVSWYEVLVFCNKLSIAEGLTPAYRILGSTDPSAWGTIPKSSNSTWNAVEIVNGSTGYRLPTEAQWEYAAKGGNGSPGNYTYAGSDNADEVAWYADNATTIHTVGTKKPNGLGIHDMSGNVWEWCYDWYGGYPQAAQTNPLGAPSGSIHVIRGGSWAFSATYIRSANRYYYGTSYQSLPIGFRLVRP